jgi:hypothetical protein
MFEDDHADTRHAEWLLSVIMQQGDTLNAEYARQERLVELLEKAEAERDVAAKVVKKIVSERHENDEQLKTLYRIIEKGDRDRDELMEILVKLTHSNEATTNKLNRYKTELAIVRLRANEHLRLDEVGSSTHFNEIQAFTKFLNKSREDYSAAISEEDRR